MASLLGDPSGFVEAGPFCFIPSVSKLQMGLKPARSTATRLPCVEPTYSMLPASAGDEYKYQWFIPTECSTAPDPALSAYKRLESDVTKYTAPSRTAGDDTTHDPSVPKAHFFCPVFASSA